MKILSRRRKAITYILTVLILIILAAVVIIEQWLLVDLPHPNQLYQRTSAPSTKIYDRHGTLLYEITDPHQGSHTPLTLEDIPLYCQQATIATEDATFYQNPGVDAWAILRALYINYQGGEILSGGSTITQQLARNLLLSPEERTEISLTRKLREAILAWRLARTYTKDEVLTLYLNETYYGNLAYGIEAASRSYFGKHAVELDLAECAMLAGLPQSPARYNPLETPAAAKNRQKIVLELMVKSRFIPQKEADSARQEKLGFAAIPFPIKAPHFVMHIRGLLEKNYGLEAIYQQGLQVHTTLDLDMQKMAQRIARYRLAELSDPKGDESAPPHNVRNAAVLVMDPLTGEILAMLGSPDYFEARIDGAVNATVATRQPGSSIKPFTYAAAFDPQHAAKYGYIPLNPASMMVDVRTAFVTQEGQPYVPENYDRTWRGPVLLRQSLASSYNLIAVKVLDYIGLDSLIDFARKAGITTFDNKNFGLALTLGGGEVRLLELTGAYSSLASGGRRIEPLAITQITDHQGNVLYDQPPEQLNPGAQIMDPRTAYLITDILSDNYARRSTFGAGNPLQLSRPAAAKTGTTQDWRDNWTLGYTPDLAVGVWVGNADNEPMRHISGVTGAAPIWHDVMEALLKNKPIRTFSIPDGLTEVTVCADNGLLPITDSTPSNRTMRYPVPCSHTFTETFIEGYDPQPRDDWHQAIAIDRRNGLLAGVGCPAEFVTFQTYTLYPSEAQVWAKKHHIPSPPETYSPFCAQPSPGDEIRVSQHDSSDDPLIFTSPDQGTVFRLVPNIPRSQQQIRVQVRPANHVSIKAITLYLNGQPLSQGTETMWQMSPGQYTFEARGVDSLGRPIEARPIDIKVRQP